MRFITRALIGTTFRATMRATVVRPAVVLTTTGAVGGFGSTFHDLRGELPVSEDVHYVTRPLDMVEGVVWHHSATKGQTIHSIAEFHIEVKKWPGIAYHFAVGHDGTIFILNDATTISFHAQGHNRSTIGVVLIGNYHERDLSEAMKEAVAKLQEHLKDEYDLEYSWMHRETKSTACPGRHAAAFLAPMMYGRRP